MTAAEFNELCDTELAAPIIALGGSQRGRSIFWESANLTVAILRTETRYMPPPQLMLLIRHRQMRDMDEEVPTSPSKRLSDYPVKLHPSEATSLLDPAFQYTPRNRWRFRGETFDYKAESFPDLRARIRHIREGLLATLAELERVWTAEHFLHQLVTHGEDAWCERMWIDDLGAATK